MSTEVFLASNVINAFARPAWLQTHRKCLGQTCSKKKESHHHHDHHHRRHDHYNHTHTLNANIVIAIAFATTIIKIIIITTADVATPSLSREGDTHGKEA